MMRIISSAVLLVAALVIFFVPTRAMLDSAQPLSAEKAELNAALGSAKQIQKLREQLQVKYNTISPDDIEKIDKKFLPSHVDSIRVILEVDSIATAHNLSLNSIDVSDDKGPSGTAGPSTDKFGTLILGFSITGDYQSFKAFLADLQRSLRITDVIDMSFTAAPKDTYTYAMKIKTYWLNIEK